MKYLLTIVFTSSFLISGIAQDLSQSFKHWYIGGVNVRLTRNTSIKASHLSSFDLNANGYRNRFGQSNLTFRQKLNDEWSVGGGYAYSFIRGSRRTTTYHRVHINTAHSVKFGKVRMTNQVQLEKYFPQLQKFGARAVFSNKWSYSNKKWPLRLSPFVRNQLYWYQGGTPITYWVDEAELADIPEGEEVEESIEGVPNGWHRYRFTGGVRMKLSKPLALSVFYIRQIEFNTGWSPYSELNVPNKSGTKIKRPFNNYSLIGLSLTYTLKLY